MLVEHGGRSLSLHELAEQQNKEVKLLGPTTPSSMSRLLTFVGVFFDGHFENLMGMFTFSSHMTR